MRSLSAYLQDSEIMEQSYLLEQEVFNKYLEELKDSFIVRKNVVWKQQDIRYEFDIVIYDKQEHIIAVIEVKLSLKERSRALSSAKATVRAAFKVTGCKYGIVTDGENFYIFDREEGTDLDIQPVDFAKSIKVIVQFEKHIDVSSKSKKYDKICKLLRENNFGEAADDIRQADKCVEFSSEKSENEFWENLVEQVSKSQNNAHILRMSEGSSFYQYTTLESLFQIVYNGTQRLCGIAGMNDRSEANFFEGLLGENFSYERIINKTFLMSCSTQRDNLTMWRMYGDEAKGACIEYEISDDYDESTFVIHPVCYIDKKNLDGRIIMLQQAIVQGLKFKKFDIWKHFFKPIEFKDEHEIRILFIKNKNVEGVCGGWFLNSTKIINPYVEFNLFDKTKNSVKFSLKIKGILLGPNCYEADTNIRQLKDLIEQKYSKQLFIGKSSIDIYRSK